MHVAFATQGSQCICYFDIKTSSCSSLLIRVNFRLRVCLRCQVSVGCVCVGYLAQHHFLFKATTQCQKDDTLNTSDCDMDRMMQQQKHVIYLMYTRL